MTAPAGQRSLTVITTHMNADFDAMASMLAAQKLYPEALVVFPGSQEKNLRNFFINSMVYLFNMADIGDIDFSRIKRLVLVDTRQPGRIGRFSELIGEDGVEIHVYDHHPLMESDVRGDLEHCRLTGATVTILSEIIREKGISITADEATIMCLGIYEDTGSFTFSSTTEADFLAAAFLLSSGANLNIVSDMISREISPQQVSLLNDMIQAATRHDINGVEVVVTTVTTESYVPDFAFLVHKLVKMENLDAIFTIAAMGSKIYVVARSRLPEVDVGAILSPLGGGGHTFAASAAIRGTPLPQVEHRLMALLYEKIRSRRLARHLMSAPAITIGSEISCQAANTTLTRYNVNALVVIDSANGADRLRGYITRQIIEKALYHGLDQVPVKEYMHTEIEWVGPDAAIEEIQEKIIGSKQRILPVVADDRVVGVITRTDLLNVLVRRSKDPDKKDAAIEHSAHLRTRNVKKLLKERLTDRLFELLQDLGQAAEKAGCSAYVVGGFVRDLFLYRPNEDVDIVVEGDGIAFARRFAASAAARIHAHEKFGTAVIIFPDGFKVDVASARMEYYRSPASLPEVEMSSIKLDLFRRDFTINTLAIHLNPPRFGTLIDFFSALRDIKERVIRVLHNLSFVEDPTRVFRAIRFEQRFGFSIGKLTGGLIENAVRMDFFRRLSGRRVFAELKLILSEENPLDALKRMQDYGLMRVVHPGLQLTDDRLDSFDTVKKVLSWHDLLFLDESYMKWAVYFLALIRPCDRATSEKICERFELPPRHRGLFCKDRFKAEACLKSLERRPPVKNSSLYRKLAPFRTELILYMMASTRRERVIRDISRYYTRLRQVRPSISGADLQQMGLAPGPIYREILQKVLDGKLNDRFKTREDELAFARNYASSV